MSSTNRLAVILDCAAGRIYAREARDILDIDQAEFEEVLDEYQR